MEFNYSFSIAFIIHRAKFHLYLRQLLRSAHDLKFVATRENQSKPIES